MKDIPRIYRVDSNGKEQKFKELLERVSGRGKELIAEIRANASKNKEDISYNDIADLKIDLELYRGG
jgi:hypothetical protein